MCFLMLFFFSVLLPRGRGWSEACGSTRRREKVVSDTGGRDPGHTQPDDAGLNPSVRGVSVWVRCFHRRRSTQAQCDPWWMSWPEFLKATLTKTILRFLDVF